MLTNDHTTAINWRQQRGAAIAATSRIRQTSEGWRVPSQSCKHPHTVVLGAEESRNRASFPGCFRLGELTES